MLARTARIISVALVLVAGIRAGECAIDSLHSLMSGHTTQLDRIR